ncbi:hypothetical protein A2J03_11220 [Rhodococcus sp. EPR-157]|uniref:glycosyltransferase n=1 Tax=Rhodococcus sp. EPR-157 TaxID=1813677 RepID=UPI0007BC08B7|nr:glycosyltransferase [Rhodococcus sp. EPR-157]KZF00632.1 hypothetical protein A2J03_11220 [Rhodococcus sp. EPR-157]
MKILFAAHPSQASAFALAPLARAAKDSGHQVVMAGSMQTTDAITSSGLPAYPVTDRALSEFILFDRDGERLPPASTDEDMVFGAGRFFGRYAATAYHSLKSLAKTFSPDVVVGGSLSFAAPLIAARLRVPYVRQTWDMYEIAPYIPGAEAELASEMAELDLRNLPEPSTTLDVSPAMLQTRHDGSPHKPLRFVPSNTQTAIEPWMLGAPAGKKRICVTMGSRVETTDTYDTSFKKLRDLVEALSRLNAELLVAAPRAVADSVRHLIPHGHAGFIPLDFVAPSCDAIVHHAGGVSTLTALDAGTPQVMLPDAEIWQRTTDRIEAYGAGVSVHPGPDVVERAVDACDRVLSDSSYRSAAQGFQAQIREMPTPAEQVVEIEFRR